ncbi:hypothetical protein AS034_13885 [[Bacillus] enclensis]|uniref:Uncharacterized protein n=1 Tax=[Bacillus] enclensis TaxID=1402860 RepID=A0A0V8HH14_9BACI|nr:hypothetical protein AS034_13885 [[Bacillus] enclensis]SCC17031.1 hypothetical protein GA0061094_2866 [[Bacillus] enclensis]
MTGAPVIELGYGPLRQYPKRPVWQHIGELGWHRDQISPPRLKRSWGWDFFIVVLLKMGDVLNKIAGRNG